MSEQWQASPEGVVASRTRDLMVSIRDLSTSPLEFVVAERDDIVLARTELSRLIRRIDLQSKVGE